MSVLRKMILSLGFVLAILSFTNRPVIAQGRNVSLQVFYDELSYYGDWVDNPEYGYVWRPNVGRDFRPYYTNGRWVMTQYGNTWVSDFNWGWAPFHYGRWYYDSYDGWVWVPDTVWGPAWVEWRTGSGYYGWAPMGPRISINVNIGSGYYPDNYWVFIPQRYIYYNNYGRYWNPGRNVTIIRNTTIINNIYVNNNVRYVSGPGLRDVRRATGSRVQVHRVENSPRPGNARLGRNSLSVYRPEIDRSRDAVPGRVATSNGTRPSRTDTRDNRNNTGNRPERDNNGVSRPNRPERDPSAVPSRERNNVPNRETENIERPQRDRPVRESMPDRTERPQRPQAERPEPVQTRPSSERSESGRTQRPERSQQREQRPAPTMQRNEGRSSSPDNGRESSRSSSGRGGAERPSR